MTVRRSPESRQPPRRRPRRTDAPLGRELNLGPVSSGWLAEIGIRTLADVERLGPVEICRILRMHGYPSSLNLAYALEGALLGVHWTKLPANVKAELRQALKVDRR